jgi:serine/threonine-protein kinase
VIHRDIKPGNIMLTPAGTAKLMDFGLAAVNSDRRLTRTGVVMGSLNYMSPEQVRGEQPSPRSDIYSFGLTLYEMLTGIRGIQGESDYAIMAAQLNAMPQPPERLNPSIPRGLSDTVLRAIAKDPANRFASAEEFRAALEAGQTASQTLEKTERYPVRRTHTWTYLGLGTAAAVVLLAGVWIYRSAPEATPASIPVSAPVTVPESGNAEPAVQNPPDDPASEVPTASTPSPDNGPKGPNAPPHTPARVDTPRATAPLPVRKPASQEAAAPVSAADRAALLELQSTYDSALARVRMARGAYEELRARLEPIRQSPRASLLTGVTTAESAIERARQRMTEGALEDARVEVRRADYVARQVLKEFGR